MVALKKRVVLVSVVALTVIAATVLTLVWNGVVLLNAPSSQQYPIRGVDVSSYQGEIDWNTLANEDVSFAFIKATEGSSYIDKRFTYNFKQAQNTDLYIGAYHFFSYDSAGETQAENFIKNVKAFDGMLPPVVDVEFYGDKEKNPPDRKDVTRELDAMLSALERHYGLKPIIYATEKSYDLYLSHSYKDYDIWIRDVITTPKLSDGREWTFWQYTNRETLKGYKGKEQFIDMNVFSGSEKNFENYPKY